MPYFINKERGKLTISKISHDVYEWQVDIPCPPIPAKMDWKRSIYDLAERAGYTATLEHSCATLTAPGKQPAIFGGDVEVGSWRRVLCDIIDAIMRGDLIPANTETPATLLPPVPDAPVVPGLEGSFNPMALVDQQLKGYNPEWLRVCGSIPYSDAMRLGALEPSIQRIITHGRSTGLVIIECACGRLIVGGRDIVDGMPQSRWTGCGCCDDNSIARDRIIKRGWREWCTMKLVGRTDCALHKVLEHAGLSTECKLTGGIKDFLVWYTRQVKQAHGAHMLMRLDPTKPFSYDNLQICTGKRPTVRDPYNDDSFKIII